MLNHHKKGGKKERERNKYGIVVWNLELGNIPLQPEADPPMADNAESKTGEKDNDTSK